MTLAAGTYQLGPDRGSLTVKTYREGVAAKVGHDLVIEVTRWEAGLEVGEADAASVWLTADSRSLAVREGVRGVKPLTDKDRGDIAKTIEEKVLRGQPIEFRSNAVRMPDGGGRIAVDGELTMAGSSRPVSVQLDTDADGQVRGAVTLTQSAWGIKPYRGLMGALKVRDDVELVFEARLAGD